MATNFPGPYGLEIVYTVSGLEHRQLLNVVVDGTPDVGDLPTTIFFVDRDGANISMDTAVDELIALYLPLFSATATFIEASLWRYVDGTYDRTYITGYAIGEDGTNAGAYAPAKYRKFSFRTQNGGMMYITLLESIVDANTQESYPFASSASNAIANYVVNSGAWIYARDNSYPVFPLRLSDGQNEVLFRKRFRP